MRIIAVGMNDRDARWHDLYIVDIRTGGRQLVYENRDEIASFILDGQLSLRLATSTRDMEGGSAILKWNGRGFEELISSERRARYRTLAYQSRRRRVVPAQFGRAGQGRHAARRLDHLSD